MDYYRIEDSEEGRRLDAFLNDEIGDISRSALQRLIQDGSILVNDKCVNKSCKLKAGDVISVEIPPPKELNIEAENIPLDILYEDNDIIVINKPQGMVVHPAPGHYSGTLVNALMYHCRDALSGINGVMRPGIVHRIDKDTSGVLVAAKTDAAHRALTEQLAAHSMTRIYNAIVYNCFAEDEGTVDKPIARSKNDRKKMAVDPRGRRAVTHYRQLEKLGKFSYAQFRLETGRTHQIRVHMAHIRHPLLGDEVYGPKNPPYSLHGQALHARALGFIHPRTNQYIHFESPLPDYFAELLDLLRKKSM